MCMYMCEYVCAYMCMCDIPVPCQTFRIHVSVVPLVNPEGRPSILSYLFCQERSWCTMFNMEPHKDEPSLQIICSEAPQPCLSCLHPH